MKALLLKDWYVMRKNCRVYLLLSVVFLAVSCVFDGSVFLLYYPCLLCGMIPIVLLSFDERSGWLRYSGTLPYTRTMIVSEKYCIGLLSLLAILTVAGVSQLVRMGFHGSVPGPGGLLVTLLLMFLLTTLSTALCLPFLFRLGTEKGRMVYYVMVGLFIAGISFVTSMRENMPNVNIKLNVLLIGLAVAAVGIYALSWYLSVLFYRKREI